MEILRKKKTIDILLCILSREPNNDMRCVSNSISAETVIILCITFLCLNTTGPFTCTVGCHKMWVLICKYQVCSSPTLPMYVYSCAVVVILKLQMARDGETAK